ncbi:MAG: hypothetical protein AAF208_00260 [Cyanobacteria bacterium P01_A01_bin.45]
MKVNNIFSEDFGDKPASNITSVDSNTQAVSITDTCEIPNYYQQYIDDLNKTISELKITAEKDSQKQERIINRLRFRLGLFSFFWFFTVLILSGTFGIFSFQWYNQMQMQKQLANISPEKIQEFEKTRADIQELSQTVIPNMQAEISTNQEKITKVTSNIDTSQRSISVLVKAMQELVSLQEADKSSENQNSQNQQQQQSSLEVSPKSKSKEIKSN